MKIKNHKLASTKPVIGHKEFVLCPIVLPFTHLCIFKYAQVFFAKMGCFSVYLPCALHTSTCDRENECVNSYLHMASFVSQGWLDLEDRLILNRGI